MEFRTRWKKEGRTVEEDLKKIIGESETCGMSIVEEEPWIRISVAHKSK